MKKNSTYAHTTSWTDTLCPCKLCTNLRKLEQNDELTIFNIKAKKKLTKAQYLKLAEMIRRA